MIRIRWILLSALALIIISAAIYLYYFHDPAQESFFPKCLWLQMTGTRCPGCGSQRAIHALLHGSVAGAWHYNPLVVLSIPLLIVYTAAEVVRKRNPRFYNTVNHPKAIAAIFFLVIAWWVLRNIFDI